MKYKKNSCNNYNILPKINFIKKSIYLIGIGGIGMCGIAKILIKLGYKVSGSDIIETYTIKDLILLGAKIYLGHNNTEHISKTDIVVISTAIKPNNPELLFAINNNMYIMHRAHMLSELMKYYYNIIVCGTHGKTTTTAMICEIFQLLKQHPTFINGGIIKKTKLYANLGNSKYFITEADESDKSFLYFNPIINVITNIDNEHLECYANNIELLKEHFLKLMEKVPFYGCNIICIDNNHIMQLIHNNNIKNNIITYGFKNNAHYQLTNYIQKNNTSTFNITNIQQNMTWLIKLNIPGIHNALNATAAFITSQYIGLKNSQIITALEQYSGTQRRYDIRGYFKYNFNKFHGKVVIIDDYGHHPTEIKMTIQTIRYSWPKYRLIMIFQPHKYSRIKNLLQEFVQILSTVDNLFILDVYSAGEQYLKDANSYILYKKIKKLGIVIPVLSKWYNYYDLITSISTVLKGKDILLFQGAGDINCLSSLLIKNKFKI
ncbi:UDP-N-acetylmuramate--L-alanine ligase [Enterobacteriaceae endosymbiont of Neohaemonia nigricornis]|uniref:UDP-N-acetylmuramate--L-alanine ligase n=1 Tax=Enterobacteriaceae endosymbiont of Neohaemonia nigricornis TaxID=2675792 RepID=UPI001449B765|nr:UDP-N-acetylmuramate--L-alanine ligase [Enterobacteriaceae endosymbiont of Neohaemonia nigricornis]QJC30344.1 UDP-N-acetylmuramate--L-alanine ligase [Enterobacteriaceae endosymbiont of Neohaemonia nigricornis]